MSVYLGMTFDDGEQRLVDSQERRVVNGWAQVIKRQRLQRSEDQNHMLRVSEESLALAQQCCQRRHRRNGKRKGQREILTGQSHQDLQQQNETIVKNKRWRFRNKGFYIQIKQCFELNNGTISSALS